MNMSLTKKPLIRHISLPFQVDSLIQAPVVAPNLTLHNQWISKIAIIPAKHYIIKNFDISINLSSVESSANLYTAKIAIPFLNIQGLQQDQGIDVILNDWGNPQYDYQNVVNNPDKTVSSQDLNSAVINSVLFPVQNRLLLNVSRGAITAPSYYNNIIAQKPIASLANVSTNTLTGICVPKFDSRDFYFRSVNYNGLLFSFSPVMSAVSTSLVSLSGFIGFDLYQYDLDNLSD